MCQIVIHLAVLIKVNQKVRILINSLRFSNTISEWRKNQLLVIELVLL